MIFRRSSECMCSCRRELQAPDCFIPRYQQNRGLGGPWTGLLYNTPNANSTDLQLSDVAEQYQNISIICQCLLSSWNVMAHGDARQGKWRGNWRIEWVSSTLHTTSEYGVSSITTADVHTSAASSRVNWRPCRFKWTRPFRRKTKSGFLRVCRHISNAVYHFVTHTEKVW
jgi:hypothetical protein